MICFGENLINIASSKGYIVFKNKFYRFTTSLTTKKMNKKKYNLYEKVKHITLSRIGYNGKRHYKEIDRALPIRRAVVSR
jgi:hypothetical protein